MVTHTILEKQRTVAGWTYSMHARAHAKSIVGGGFINSDMRNDETSLGSFLHENPIWRLQVILK